MSWHEDILAEHDARYAELCRKVKELQQWLKKEHGVRARRRIAKCDGSLYLQVDRRDEAKVEKLDKMLRHYELECRRLPSTGGYYGGDGQPYEPPLLLTVGRTGPKSLSTHATELTLTERTLYKDETPRDRRQRRRVERRLAVKDATRPAWARLRGVLRKNGMQWSFNDVFDTHRRIKVGGDVAAYIENNLAKLAIAETHDVEIIVTRPGMGRETKDHCIRIYPRRR